MAPPPRVADSASTSPTFPPEKTQVDASDALGVFTFLWSHVMLLQVVKLVLPLLSGLTEGSSLKMSLQAIVETASRQPLDTGCALVLATACLAGTLQPHSGCTTVALCTSSVLVLWLTGSQSNHVFMDIAVCIAVLATFSMQRKRWLAQAVYAMRLFLVVLYFITALHKMNSDWGNVKYSCCTLMLGGVLALPPFRWLLLFTPMHLAPTVATLTELLLPTALSLGLDQRITAVVGCLFHVTICQMLSPMSVYPFSLLMVPPYVFVIPDRASALFDRLRDGRLSRWLLLACFAALSGAWTPLMAAGDLQGANQAPFEYPPYGLWAVGVVWCNMANLAMIGAALLPWRYLCWRSATGTAVFPATAPPPVPTCAGRLLAVGVFAFGVTPYVGLRNYPALAMFSNLRVEGGRSNHWFLADDFDFLGWQRDFVTVHATDIPQLRLVQVDLAPLFTPATKAALASVGIEQEFWITPPFKAWPYPETREFRSYSMPFLELRRRLAPLRAAGISTGSVRYTRTKAAPKLMVPRLRQLLGAWLPDRTRDEEQANLTYDLSTGGNPELEELLPWWLAMVVRFRTFDLEYSPCRH